MANRRIDRSNPNDASMLEGHSRTQARIDSEAGGLGHDSNWLADGSSSRHEQHLPGGFERGQWGARYSRFSVGRLVKEQDSLDDEEEANSRSLLNNTFRDGMTRMKQELVAVRLKELRGY